MDFQKIILYGALFFTLLMMWEAWKEDYGPKPPEAQVSGEQQQRPQEDLPQPKAASGDSQQADLPGSESNASLQSAKRVKVVTDLFEAEIDEVGGDLRYLALRDYPVDLEQPDTPFVLFADSREKLFVAQSALLGASGVEAPNHYAHFKAAQPEYRMGDGSDTLQVRLSWESGEGLKVDKIYTFHRGNYLVDVAFEVTNQAATPWKGYMYRQLQQRKPEESKGFIYTYTGGVIYSEEEKYEKVDFDDMAQTNLDRSISGGWAAMIQHYFLAAWIPQQGEANSYYTKSPGGERYVIGQVGSAIEVAPGESGRFEAGLFAGPKLQDHLEEVAEGLELTVDYGVLTFIAKPLFVVLKWFHELIGNWGWAIIFVTILIKLIFYPLSATSYKSMANMRKVQPKMQALKEQFGDDKQRMTEAMMKLYKEEKINPLGGCLPILVQIPVFIALYWVLLETVELRQAPFILWIHDLSKQDPYFILPVLMGITMFIQHRLNPAAMDPMQKKVMSALPFIFTVFFAFFPSGLVLYWVVNNTLSIAQQWYITRIVIGSK